MKIVRIRSVWVRLGRYFTRIDPIVSRMPLGCLPDSKSPPKNPEIQEIREMPEKQYKSTISLVPFGVLQC